MSSKVIPSMPAAPLLAFTRAKAFLRLLRSTTASMDGRVAARLSMSGFAARVSVSWTAALRASPFAPDLFLLPHGPYEIAALLASSTVRAFAGLPRLLCPLLTSALRSGRLATPAVPLPGQQHRPPEVRSTAFAARPPDLPPRSLMTLDFAITCSLVRPGRPRYPVLVHRAAALLHASFRPHLAVGSARAEQALALC
jgi:hypothetical protein